MLGFWYSFYLIYLKDTKDDIRSPYSILINLLFSTILAAFYSYSLNLHIFKELPNFEGVILASLFISAVLYQSASSKSELESGAIKIINMSRLEPAGVYLAKVIVHFQSQIVFILYTIPIYYFFLKNNEDINFNQVLILFIVMFVCSLGLSSLITLIHKTSQNYSTQNILPIIILPSAFPLLLFALRFLEIANKSNSLLSIKIEYYSLLFAPVLLYLSLGSLLYFYLNND